MQLLTSNNSTLEFQIIYCVKYIENKTWKRRFFLSIMNYFSTNHQNNESLYLICLIISNSSNQLLKLNNPVY
jgi:hypothetical protein